MRPSPRPRRLFTLLFFAASNRSAAPSTISAQAGPQAILEGRQRAPHRFRELVVNGAPRIKDPVSREAPFHLALPLRRRYWLGRALPMEVLRDRVEEFALDSVQGLQLALDSVAPQDLGLEREGLDLSPGLHEARPSPFVCALHSGLGFLVFRVRVLLRVGR